MNPEQPEQMELETMKNLLNLGTISIDAYLKQLEKELEGEPQKQERHPLFHDLFATFAASFPDPFTAFVFTFWPCYFIGFSISFLVLTLLFL